MTNQSLYIHRRSKQKKSQQIVGASFFSSLEPIGWIVLAATAAGMLCWTWGKWLDVQIDFGRELYIPWQLTEGKVLYRDLAYFNGPVSPYLNALWFTLFGASLRTLVLCNLALLTCSAVLLYKILRTISGGWTAFLGTELFFLLFAFAHTLAGGNYNFICPYSHEMTHGLLFILAGIWSVHQYSQKGGWKWIAAASVSAGLIFLTKVEIAVAGISAIGGGMLIAERNRIDSSLNRILFISCMFILISIAVATTVWGVLAQAMNPEQALQGMLGSWKYAGDNSLTQLPFYRQFMGVLDWKGNLWFLMKWSGIYAVSLLLTAGIAMMIRSRKPWFHMAFGLIVLILEILLLGLNWRRISWLDVFRPLPLVVFTASTLYFIRWFQNREPKESDPIRPLTISFLILSFLLLLKMILRARIHHYGFGLGLPAVMITLISLEWIARWIHRKGGSAAVFRGEYLAMLVVLVFSYLQIQNLHMERKTVQIGDGADTFYTDIRGVFYNPLIAQIKKQIPLDGTLAVLPEGIMLNYLTRRVTSTPYYSVIPPEILMFGESRILEDFSNHPPDFIAILPRNCREYGVESFGQGYGQTLWSWIQKNYHETYALNSSGPPGEQIFLLKRNTKNK